MEDLMATFGYQHDISKRDGGYDRDHPAGPNRRAGRRMLRPLAILLSLIAGSALADDGRFVIVNGTGLSIRELVLSPHDLNAWSPSVLQAPVLKPGEAREVTVPSSFVGCNQDFKVVFEDNDAQPIWQYLNLCDLKKIRLVYDRLSGIATATYDE
jgi:hypothetical protein